jgi:hypothetical protein
MSKVSNVQPQTTEEKYEQNDPMLTLQFYHYPNTDFCWQIFATSVVLVKGVESIKFSSSSPHLDTWARVLLQGL